MKKSLIIALALMLVLAFASSAMAAQALVNERGFGFYEPTVKSFTYDGTTYYPYEIYLPSEIVNDSYRIHSSYAKNTDACASCHSTHTAVGGALLQWASAYETCMACHDGTVATTYNVATGVVGLMADKNFGGPTPGGAFNTVATGDLSNSTHNATGVVTVTSAPGGSTVKEVIAFAGPETSTKDRWTNEFGCESCHSPHGLGGNARLLDGDANGAAAKLAVQNKWAGSAAKGAVKAGDIGIAKTGSGILDATDSLFATVGAKVYYTFAPTAAVDKAAYNVGDGYLFLKSRSYPLNAYADGVDKTKTWTVDNFKGYTRLITNLAADTAVDVKIYGTPTIKVVMNIKNYLNNGGAESVQHVSGMNNFCGTCHTDYNTASFEVFTKEGGFEGSSEILTGTYSKAHRHQVGRAYRAKAPLDLEYSKGDASVDGTDTIFTCLTCHVAHGVSEEYWQRTLVGTGGDSSPAIKGWTTDMVTQGEIAGSSALKRMPNMGTCEVCHAKGDGNQGYASNSTYGAANPLLNGSTPSAELAAAFKSQDNAEYVGFSNAENSCAQCHVEAVNTFLGTQHAYLVAPMKFGIYYSKLSTAGGRVSPQGNASDAGYSALQKVYDDLTTIDYISSVEASILDEAYTPFDGESVKIQDILTVGQLPIGGKTAAARELIVRYKDGANVEYGVAGTINYANGEWTLAAGGAEIEKDKYKTCFPCHAAVATDAVGTQSKALLTDYYAYFDYKVNGGTVVARPGVDLGVTCETCHGEAGNHVIAPNSQNIFNPSSLSETNQSRICGRCHTGAGNALGYQAYYRPQNLESAAALEVGDDGVFDAGDVAALKTQISKGNNAGGFDGRTGLTYATVGEKLQAIFKLAYEYSATQLKDSNGKLPNETGYDAALLASSANGNPTYYSAEGKKWTAPNHAQYVMFATNKHFTSGEISCVTCHDAHSEEIDPAQLKMDKVDLCASCHGAAVGGSRYALNYMPKVFGKTVAFHDFGVIVKNTLPNNGAGAIPGVTKSTHTFRNSALGTAANPQD